VIVSERLHMPSLGGATEWFNSEPLDAAKLRGFQARDAHLVLSSAAREPIPFRVSVDGEAPGPAHGVDIDEDGNGLLRDGRLYQLVREHDAVGERILEITFLRPGAEAYAFTFG
jgi:Thioredoxin like C-terminal domain